MLQRSTAEDQEIHVPATLYFCLWLPYSKCLKLSRTYGCPTRLEIKQLAKFLEKFTTIPEINLEETTLNTPLEYSITLLVTAMREENRKKRCTNENALNYCKQILLLSNNANTHDLDTNQIKSIAKSHPAR